MLAKQICYGVLMIVMLQVALACNGYKAKLLKAENCAGDDAVITIVPEFKVKLNKECKLIPKGCVQNKPFTTAIADYTIKKDGILLKQDKMDFCKATPDAATMNYMQMFGVPSSCPVDEGKTCAKNQSVDLSQYKSLMSMARGHITIDAKIEHDTGKSCFHIEMEIAKS